VVPYGAPIAVVAPASAYDPQRLAAGLRILTDLGYAPEVIGAEARPHLSFAAPDDERLALLVGALSAPEYAAVWAVRGGYGVTRLLDQIPWGRLKARPVLGFSDLTPLLDACANRLGSPAIHGPVVHSLSSTDDTSLRHLDDLLQGRPTAPIPGEAWVSGDASGPVVGGNLCLLAATCGTPFQVDTSGAILVLEEVGEPAYRVDRMLTQLRSAGMLDEIVGVAVGRMTACNAPVDASWSVADFLREQLCHLGVPVLANLPIGHGAANRAFAVREQGRIRGSSLILGSAPSQT